MTGAVSASMQARSGGSHSMYVSGVSTIHSSMYGCGAHLASPRCLSMVCVG